MKKQKKQQPQALKTDIRSLQKAFSPEQATQILESLQPFLYGRGDSKEPGEHG